MHMWAFKLRITALPIVMLRMGRVSTRYFGKFVGLKYVERWDFNFDDSRTIRDERDDHPGHFCGIQDRSVKGRC